MWSFLLLPKRPSIRLEDQRDLVCIGLAIITIVLFFPTITFKFLLYDDPGYVYYNPHVSSGLSLQNLIWAFTALHGDISYWHPLTWLSHQLDCQIFHLRAGAHHFDNVVFHASNTILVFLILLRITKASWRSAVVAALFALHPLHVESVAWISERKDVLCGFFSLLTIWSYLNFCESRNVRRYVLTLVLFAFALMSKPMAVTVPLMLLLLDIWPLQRFPQRSAFELLVEKMPFFVLSIATCFVTVIAQKEVGAVASISLLSPSSRIDNAVVSYVLYLKKFFWPNDLAVIYTRAGPWPFWQVILSIVILALISTLAWVLRAKRPYVLIGWLWFAITLFPVSGLVQAGAQYMADRYTYLSSIGIFLIVVWGIADMAAVTKTRTFIQSAAAVLVLIACFVLTQRQLAYWVDDISLLRHAIHVTSNNWLAHCDLGVTLATQSRFDEALAQFSASLDIVPNNYLVERQIAGCLAKQGKTEEAILNYERSIAHAPNYYEGYFELSRLLVSCSDAKFRDGKRAIRYAQAACNLTSHRKPRCLAALAAAYAETCEFKQAKQIAEEAMKVASSDGLNELAKEIQGKISEYETASSKKKDSRNE